MAELYYLQQAWEKLEDVASEGLRIDDMDNPRLWYIRALKEREEGRYPKAVEYFSEALERDFRENDHYLARAETYVKVGEFSLALSDCELVIGDEPANLAAWYVKGLAYLGLEDPGAADECFQKLIVLEQEFAPAWEGRAEVC